LKVIKMSPHLAKHVKSICITDNSCDVMYKLFNKVYPDLVNLQKLELDQPSSNSEALNFMTPITTSPIRSSCKIILSRATFTSSPHLLTFLRSFPLLDDLSLRDVRLLDEKQGLSMGESAPFLRLTKLLIRFRSEVINALSTILDKSSIHTLTIVGLVKESTSSLNRVLEMLGASLKHLDLQFEITGAESGTDSASSDAEMKH
jgi:hypothetical protein